MNPFRLSLPTLAGALLAAGSALPAHALSVPAPLAAPAWQTLTTQVGARGVQIYECRASGAGHAWAFVAPEAELLDHDGRVVGWHGAGPRWRFADGSLVTGRVKARADAPQPQALPWLLLEGTSRWPQDRLASVRSIQRLNTEGGLPPDDGCDAASAGHVVRVPYTADYLFYRGR